MLQLCGMDPLDERQKSAISAILSLIAPLSQGPHASMIRAVRFDIPDVV
jgi:hypothetical protein